MSRGETWRWLPCKLVGDSNMRPTGLPNCLHAHHLPHGGCYQTRSGPQLVQPRLITGKAGAPGHKASTQTPPAAPALTINHSTAAMLASVVPGSSQGCITSAHPGKSQRPKLTEGQECAGKAHREASPAQGLGTAPKAFRFRLSFWVRGSSVLKYTFCKVLEPDQAHRNPRFHHSLIE